MKLLALTFLIIGNLVANQAYADDVSPQPLTRADCDKAGMAWDENANVCIANSGEVSSQPLTRFDCNKAGVAWNDNANACRISIPRRRDHAQLRGGGYLKPASNEKRMRYGRHDVERQGECVR